MTDTGRRGTGAVLPPLIAAALLLAGLLGVVAQQRHALREAAWPQPGEAFWSVRRADGSTALRFPPSSQPGLPLSAGDTLRWNEEDGPWHRFETLLVAIECEPETTLELRLRDGATRLVLPADSARLELFTGTARTPAQDVEIEPTLEGRPLTLRLGLKGPALQVSVNGAPALQAPALAGPAGAMSLQVSGGGARVWRIAATGTGTNQPGDWMRFSEEAAWMLPDAAALRDAGRLVAATAIMAFFALALFVRALCAGRPPLGALLTGATWLGAAAVAGALPALAAALLAQDADALPARWWDAHVLAGVGALLVPVALVLALRKLRPHVRTPSPPQRFDRARALGLALLLAGATSWLISRDVLAQLLPRRERERQVTARATPPPFEREAEATLDLGNALAIPGPMTDLDLRAQVLLAPGAALGVRLHAADTDAARGALLMLSTDPRLRSGWWREDTLDFEPLGEAAPAVPAERTVALSVSVRGRRFEASLDGVPFASAEDDTHPVGGAVLLAQRGSASVSALSLQPRPATPLPEPSAWNERAALLGPVLAPAAALALFALLAAALLRRPWPSLLEPAAFACVPLIVATLAFREEGLIAAGALRWAGLGAVAVLMLVVGLRSEPGRAGRGSLALLGAAAGVPLVLQFAVPDGVVLPDVRQHKARYADWSGERQEEDLLHLTHPRLRLFNDWLARHELRSGAHELAKPAGVRRVMSLGASCTWGFRLPPGEGLEWPSLMGRRFGEDVEVLNAGYIAAPGFVLLRFFREVLLAYQPDVLVLSLYFADAYSFSQADEQGYYARITAPGFSRSWMDDAALLARLEPDRERYERLLHGLGSGEGGGSAAWDGPTGEASPPTRYEAVLREYAALCREHGVKLVLVLEPVAGDVPSIWKDEFVAVMQRVAEENGAPFVDPRPALAQAGGERLFFDAVHPNAAGHAVLARQIAPVVSEVLEQLDTR